MKWPSSSSIDGFGWGLVVALLLASLHLWYVTDALVLAAWAIGFWRAVVLRRARRRVSEGGAKVISLAERRAQREIDHDDEPRGAA